MQDVYRRSLFRKIFPKPAYLTPELYLAYCGGLLNCLFLLAALFSKRRKEFALLWLVGNLIMLSSLILPAFARWQHGVQQSLSPRYHYGSLLGVYLILIAACAPLILCSLRSNSKRIKQSLMLLISIGVAWNCARQMRMGTDARWFTQHGTKHRLWVAQERDWESRLAKEYRGSAIGYYGEGTALVDLQPEFTPGITPGRDPRQIYDVLSELDEKKYPRFKHLKKVP